MSEKDLLVKAKPEEDIAIIESNSADGMIFMKREFDDSATATITGDHVNEWFQKFREAGLKFSFRLSEAVT